MTINTTIIILLTGALLTLTLQRLAKYCREHYVKGEVGRIEQALLEHQACGYVLVYWNQAGSYRAVHDGLIYDDITEAESVLLALRHACEKLGRRECQPCVDELPQKIIDDVEKEIAGQHRVRDAEEDLNKIMEEAA